MPFLQRKRPKIFLSSILAVYLLSVFTDNVFAQGEPNIHIGALEIRPFVSVKETYDSNIYLEPKGEENDDFITDVALGVRAEMPLLPERGKDFMLKGSYQADIREFWNNDKCNSVDHSLKGLLNCKFANDFRLRVKEHFKETADPLNSERTALEERWRNVVDGTFGYNREKITLEAGYMNIRDRYNRLNNLNKYEHVMTGSVFYHIFPKTSVLTEYNFGVVTYDNNKTNSDSKYHQIQLGLTGDLWPKIIGTVKAGCRSTSYDKSDKADFSGLVLSANIKYDVRERTSMNLYAQRTSQEASYSTNSYFESNRIGLKVDHQLTEKLFLVLGGSYQLNKYPDETTEGSVSAKRKDHIYGGSTGLRYEINDRMSLETGYEYKQRDSKFAAFDYKDNRFTTKLSLIF